MRCSRQCRCHPACPSQLSVSTTRKTRPTSRFAFSKADVRVGIGYDSHPFAKGRKLILGGVEIPHSKGLGGNSDADAVAHAVTVAILGAGGLGDIVRMFPVTDKRWKDANSIDLFN